MSGQAIGHFPDLCFLWDEVIHENASVQDFGGFGDACAGWQCQSLRYTAELGSIPASAAHDI
jgi:hypothetical protein